MMLSGGERNKITLIVLVISLGAWLLPPPGPPLPAKLTPLQNDHSNQGA